MLMCEIVNKFDDQNFQNIVGKLCQGSERKIRFEAVLCYVIKGGNAESFSIDFCLACA